MTKIRFHGSPGPNSLLISRGCANPWMDLTKQPLIAIMVTAMSSLSPSPRIKNLIKNTRLIQDKFSTASRKSAENTPPHSSQNSGLEELLPRIRDLQKKSLHLLGEQGWSPADLPIRTRRAYQWLSYLAVRTHFQAHWLTLHRLWELQSKIRVPLAYKGCQPHLELAHISPLYRIKIDQGRILISVQESFLRAPDPVLLAFWQLAYGKNSQEARCKIKNYSLSNPFQETREELEYLSLGRDAYTRGQCWDLGEIFNCVNRKYFANSIDRPHLKWSRQITFRKFGHYNFGTDTVLISRSLDSKKVPAYILDYLMFHELLHKRLGQQRIGNRHYAHTPQFRKEERRFPLLDEASAFLEQYSRQLRKDG